MATASALISDIRVKFGDTAGNYLGTDLVLTWLDQAQARFVETTFPLRRTRGYVVAANQDYFDLPADLILIEVATVDREVRRVLRWISPQDYERRRTAYQNASGYPCFWTLKEGKLYVWERFATASLTTTLGSALSTTATSITLASTDNLRSYGRAIIESEEVEYNTKGSTSISGVTRGVGGTTAASHASNATVTQVDFEIFHSYHPPALASTSTPEIQAVYHDKLELYVLYLAHMAEGHVEKSRHYFELWTAAVDEIRYNLSRRQLSRPLRVANVDSSGLGMPWTD